jgi:hypothetical protein
MPHLWKWLSDHSKEELGDDLAEGHWAVFLACALSTVLCCLQVCQSIIYEQLRQKQNQKPRRVILFWNCQAKDFGLGLLRLEPKCHMWHTSFKIYYFNLRPPCLKFMLFGVSHPSISIFILLYMSLCQLHGELGETITWMAGWLPLWFCSFAGTAKPNRFKGVLEN